MDIPAQLNCSSASHKLLRFKLQIKKKKVNKFSRPKAKCQAASTQNEITIGKKTFLKGQSVTEGLTERPRPVRKTEREASEA